LNQGDQGAGLAGLVPVPLAVVVPFAVAVIMIMAMLMVMAVVVIMPVRVLMAGSGFSATFAHFARLLPWMH